MTSPPGEPIALSINADHPALPGHFPGNPVVPGVVILEAVIQALQVHYPAAEVCGVRKMKFLRPLAPEQVFTVQPGEPGRDCLRFKCHLQDSGDLLAEGNLSLVATPANVARQESPVA